MFFYNEPEGPITPIPSYLVSPSAGSINEGATLTTTISTTNVATGTTLYWSVSGTGITAGDFSSGALTGSDQTDISGQFTFSHTLSSDLTTEGPEVMTIALFTDSLRTVQVASANVTINDTSVSPGPSYLVTPNTGSVNEGDTLTTTVSTTNVATGTTLYWSLTGSGITAGDFSSGSLSGSDQTDGSGQFTFAHTLSSDLTTEGTETLIIELFTDSIRTVQVASASVTILDTSTTPVGGIDPFFSNVSLLLKMDSDFSDSSINNYTVTVNGDTTISSTESKYGGASGYFDGNGDYLSVPNSEDLNLHDSSLWTVEAWVYRQGDYSKYRPILSKRNYGLGSAEWQIYLNISDGRLSFFNGSVYHTNTTLSSSVWQHIALVNSGSNLKMYVDGNDVYTIPSINAVSGSSNLSIGAVAGNESVEVFEGYLDDIRITKGVARYTANFTPPDSHPITGPSQVDPYFSNVSLLLKMDSDFTDSSTFAKTVTAVGDAQISSTQAKYGGASGYFDSNGDYLTIPTDTQLQFGTGDFTIEFWHYLISKVTSFPCLYSNYNGFTANSLSIFAGHDTGGSSFYQVAMAGVFPAIVSSTAITYNDWVHIALVRESGNLRFYINGQQAGSTTNNGDMSGVGALTYIGTTGDTIANSYINGYLDDFRITKGVARYTANFTPPDSLPIS